MHFISLHIFFVTQGDDALDPCQGLCSWTPSGALYTIGGSGSHSWVLALRVQCFTLLAILKSWKPWLLRGHYPPQKPLFSLQWPNIYNSCGKGIRAGKIGGIDMIIANFYHKRKLERWEAYT